MSKKTATTSLWLSPKKGVVQVELSRFKDYPNFLENLESFSGLHVPPVVPVRWTAFDDFLELIGEPGDEEYRNAVEWIKEVKRMMKGGVDIPPLVRDGKSIHDGRHRAWAAAGLKIKKAPVIDIKPYWINYMKA